MKILSTHDRHGHRRFLTLGVRLPDGQCVSSHFRGMSVGVGGTWSPCNIARGEPIRAATLRELRVIDREICRRLLDTFPHGELTVQRSYHR